MVGRSIALLAVLRGVALGQTGALKGEVADASGAVVPFADVLLKTPAEHMPVEATKTDVRGQFVFTAAPGTYELVVEAMGFERYSESVRVLAERDTVIPRISLRVGEIAKCGSGPLGPPTIYSDPLKSGETEVYGTVAGVSGEFIARVQVSLRPIKNGRFAMLITGPDGGFYFSGIAPGSYTLRATRPGYSDFVIDRLEVKDAQRTRVFEPLEMLDCLEGFRCELNRQVHAIGLCS